MEGKNEIICERISVIVPIYNTEKYLARCIESILCQTYTNLEIILVDDGSTDKSGDICDFYARKDNRVKVVHKKNGGAAAARNFALNMEIRFFTMVIPSPVPGTLLILLSSALLKGSNICFIYSGFMPIPVSSMIKR